MSIWKILLATLKGLIPKLGSFKNLGALFFTIVGLKVATLPGIEVTFGDWAMYQASIIALFYGSNQIQKWLYLRYEKQDPGTPVENAENPAEYTHRKS